MSNLYRVLESQFPRAPDRCAFETPDGRYYTFDDLRAGSAKIANWLASLGIARGSR
ncbi:MAG: malonyl-CoA synthase, partial [Betaproteobacteria bacterium]|nr:malonyl-CoA synthase [Betaproteobacteria bacterium]